LLARIDLHVEVPLIDFKALASREGGEASESIRKRVETAHGMQQERFAKHAVVYSYQAAPKLQLATVFKLQNKVGFRVPISVAFNPTT